MPIYKFHNPRWTQSMLDGHFMLSSLDYFACLALGSGDRTIGDIAEPGVRFVQSAPMVWNQDKLSPNARRVAESGLLSVGGSGSGIVVSDGIFSLPDQPAHIFSMAEGEFEDTSRGMPADYTAAFEVLDPKGFAHCLWSEGVARSGTPLRELVGEPRVEAVSYVVRTADLTGATAPVPGPFQKDVSYADQREVRMHFTDGVKWVKDQLLVTIPQPERFMTLVREGDPAAGEEPCGPDLEWETVELLNSEAFNGPAFADLLWRWRLERFIRHVSNAPYRSAPHSNQMSLAAVYRRA